MKTRKIALCVLSWGSEENVRCWVWLKKYILQASQQGSVVDELHILHVKGRGEKPGSRWDSGGPLLPDVKTATAGYRLRVEELEGTPASAIVDYVNREDIDLVVMGSKGRHQIRRTVMGSTIEYVLRRVRCASLVLRPKVGVGDSYRLKTAAAQPASAAAASSSAAPNSAAGTSPKTLHPGSPHVEAPVLSAGLAHIKSAGRNVAARLGVPSKPHHRPQPDPTAVGAADTRRVAVVVDTLDNARSLLAWLQGALLRPTDTVFVLQWKPWPLTAPLRAEQLTAAPPDLAALVAELLPSGQSVLSHQLQGDRSSIISFVAKEAIDLLAIGRCRARGARKALTGRRVSTYLYHASGCPSLLVPVGPAGAGDESSDSDADSADGDAHPSTSDDELGPLPAASPPRRARSLSPGRPDLPSYHRSSVNATALVSTLQTQLHRHATDARVVLKGFRELLVHLDDTGNIHSISPVVRHQLQPGQGRATTPDRSASPATLALQDARPGDPAATATLSAIFRRSTSPLPAPRLQGLRAASARTASAPSSTVTTPTAASTATAAATAAAAASAPTTPTASAFAAAAASSSPLAPVAAAANGTSPRPSSAAGQQSSPAATPGAGSTPRGAPSPQPPASPTPALAAAAGSSSSSNGAGSPAVGAQEPAAPAAGGSPPAGGAAAAAALGPAEGDQVEALRAQLAARDAEITELRQLLLQLQQQPQVPAEGAAAPAAPSPPAAAT